MADYGVLTGNLFASLNTGMASGDEVPSVATPVSKAEKDANKKKKAQQAGQAQGGAGKGKNQQQSGNQQAGAQQKGGAKNNNQQVGQQKKDGQQGEQNQGKSKRQKFIPVQPNMSIAGPRTQGERESRPRRNQDGSNAVPNSGSQPQQQQSGDAANATSTQGGDSQGFSKPRRDNNNNNNRRNNNQEGGFGDRRQGGDNRGFRNNRDNNQEGGFGDRRQGGDNRGFRNNNRDNNNEGGNFRRNNRDRDNNNNDGGNFRRNNRRDQNNNQAEGEQGPLGAAENSAFNAPAGDSNLSSEQNFDNFAKEGAFGRQKRNNDKNREGGFTDGDRQINDFRGRDARYNRANDHGSSERSFQRRQASGFERRDGSVRGDGARHDRRPKNAYHNRTGGQRDNAKGGAGGHNWGAEGAEVLDAEFDQGRTPTVIEPKVQEGQGISESDVAAASPLPEGASAPATPAVEGEKKEGDAAAAGTTPAADDKDGKKAAAGGKGKGEEEEEEEDNTVSYEEYLKTKSKPKVPKLAQRRKVEALPATDAIIKKDDWDDLYGSVPKPEKVVEKKKKKQGGDKKAAEKPAAPELNIQFEIRDTSRDGRGGGRGGRGRGGFGGNRGDREGAPREGGPREGGSGGDFGPRRYDNNRGDSNRGGNRGGRDNNRGGGRGGRGGRGGPRIDFGQQNFPSLSPSAGRSNQKKPQDNVANAGSGSAAPAVSSQQPQQQQQQQQTAST